ncbi:hypothetical protein [Streptomyces sp. NRRL F-5630]|uniref:hypothetical protein n=1 Tax=Streptomyces sp. NRRL F-5630 TaxID=1463864 RepID=UPI003B640FF0
MESERRSRNRLGYAVQLTTVCRPGCSWTIRSIPGPRGPWSRLDGEQKSAREPEEFTGSGREDRPRRPGGSP